MRGTTKMPTSEVAGPIDSFIADIRRLQKRLGSVNDIDLKYELEKNVYPCFITLAQQIAEIDDAIEEIVEHQESYMQPELVSVIMNAFAWAADIATQAKELKIEDELAKKRLYDAITEFEKSVELAAMGIESAATFEVDEADEADEEDEKDTKEIPIAKPEGEEVSEEEEENMSGEEDKNV